MIVSGLLAFALVVTVVCFVHALREQSTQFAQERRELLNRIQRPEQIPTGDVSSFVVPEPEPDEINDVGTIHYLDEAA